MEKESYETYEYLPASSSDGLTETNQFFVVQDDGTFLSQFSLVEGENIYANSFLLQAGPSTEVKMDEDVVVDGMCDIDQQRDNEEDIKQVSPYTEVTLTETQYNTLEQKGWILLETLEKTFLLDTVGLHDITNNEDLIQNLRREIEYDSFQENNASLVENENALVDLKSEPEISENSQDENVQLTTETLTLIKKDDGIIELKPQSESDYDVNVEDIEPHTDPPAKPEDNTLRIKTTLNLKDIPNKIVLGKTTKGKKLVAIMKSKYTFAKRTSEDTQNSKENADSSKVADSSEITPTEAEFKALMRKAQKSQYLTPPRAISESLINLIANQLIKMPSFQKNDYSLVITKEKKTDADTSLTEDIDLPPCLVTGSIKAVGNAWKFHHQPHILFQFDASNNESHLGNDNDNILYNILHVHVMEMKKVDNIERICMTVNRRYLPLASPKIDIALACTECARVFKTQEEFDEHLKASCDRRSTCETYLVTHTQPKNSEDKDPNSSENKVNLFQCKMCACSYLYSASLSKHIKETHLKVQGTVK